MHIEHVAIWTTDIERCQRFYSTYFGAIVEGRYRNHAKGFESCFLRFAHGPRMEIMKTTKLSPLVFEPGVQRMGLTHIALSVGSEQAVDGLVQRLRNDGFSILDGPRRTGDGYYECVILDPDGNRLEITA
jgi:lactoylglutathione lyase